MTPVWQSILVTALGGAALAMAATSIALARLEARTRASCESLARRVDDLSSRLRDVEARGSGQVPSESRGRAGGGPRTARLKTHPLVATETRRRIDPSATLIAVPNLAAPGSRAAASEAVTELGRRFGAIWEMADAGEPAATIARETGHPIGQVELILGLRRPTTTAAAPGEAASHG